MKYLSGGDRLTPMRMAVLLWLCTLPLVALLVLPIFGWQAAISVAAVLLVAFITACWVICANPHRY